MNPRISEGLAAARRRFGTVAPFLSGHRFWLQVATLTLLAMSAAFSWGLSSLRREAALETRLEELRRVDAAYDAWIDGLVRPTPAESLAWRSSDLAMGAVSGESSPALTIARAVASRADEVGVSNLRITMAIEDDLRSSEAVRLGGWAIEAGGEGFVVEFDSTFPGMVGFLAALPAQAAVSEVAVTAAGALLHSRVVITTRRIKPDG